MRISQLIEELKIKQLKHGDLPVYTTDESAIEGESEISGVRVIAEEKMNDWDDEYELPERIWLKL